MKRTIFLFNLLAIFLSNLHAEELYLGEKSILDRGMDSFGKSRLIQWCEKKFASDAVIKVLFGGEPASEHFQTIAKEAQNALGIPEECHVPIYKINLNVELFKEISALACAGCIVVNEERLNNASYGAQRAALFHEAVHIKYADSVASELFVSFFLALGTVGSHKIMRDYHLLQNSLLARMIVSFVAGMGALIASGRFYCKYMERRADIEGCYALCCHACVEECAEYRRIMFEKENNSLRYNGYLWAHDIAAIADELKEQNKCCVYHGKIKNE